jgi:hypothetical protein
MSIASVRPQISARKSAPRGPFVPACGRQKAKRPGLTFYPGDSLARAESDGAVDRILEVGWDIGQLHVGDIVVTELEDLRRRGYAARVGFALEGVHLYFHGVAP